METNPIAFAPSDLKRIAGIGRTKVYELIRDGRLAARKIDTRTVILASDLETFLNNLPKMEASDGNAS